jgi:hypothetical protein
MTTTGIGFITPIPSASTLLALHIGFDSYGKRYPNDTQQI